MQEILGQPGELQDNRTRGRGLQVTGRRLPRWAGSQRPDLPWGWAPAASPPKQQSNARPYHSVFSLPSLSRNTSHPFLLKNFHCLFPPAYVSFSFELIAFNMFCHFPSAHPVLSEACLAEFIHFPVSSSTFSQMANAVLCANLPSDRARSAATASPPQPGQAACGPPNVHWSYRCPRGAFQGTLTSNLQRQLSKTGGGRQAPRGWAPNPRRQWR